MQPKSKVRQKKSMNKAATALPLGLCLLIAQPDLAESCTRIFWNTNPDLMIVGRNEDYVTASHPSFVATPRGILRWGSMNEAARDRTISWTVKYGSVAIYENNRFPNDGLNEAGLTARTLYYLEGDADEKAAPGSEKKELDEDHWVGFVLDNFATVAEAVEALRNDVHIVSVIGEEGSGYSYATPKHLAIADVTGDSAIVEIQDGEVKIFHGPEYRVLTNNPSYQEQLANAAKYRNATQEDLPVSWTGADRFVRAQFFLNNFPAPRQNDAATAHGFMYSGLASALMPAGLPTPDEDKEIVKKIVANLTDPNESYGGASTYWQSITDLTNRHYRFKSLVAPSDVYFDLDDYDFSAGQPVRIYKRIDLYAQDGWSGNVAPHLSEIVGDIYDQSIE